MMEKCSDLSEEAWTVADLFTKTMAGAPRLSLHNPRFDSTESHN